MNSEHERNKFIALNFKFIPPEEIILNKDEVVIHFVSVQESFRHLLEDKSLINMLESERDKSKRKDGVIEDILNRSAFTDNPYFRENPGSYAALFYSDSVEIVNPLGSA